MYAVQHVYSGLHVSLSLVECSLHLLPLQACNLDGCKGWASLPGYVPSRVSIGFGVCRRKGWTLIVTTQQNQSYRLHLHSAVYGAKKVSNHKPEPKHGICLAKELRAHHDHTCHWPVEPRGHLCCTTSSKLVNNCCKEFIDCKRPFVFAAALNLILSIIDEVFESSNVLFFLIGNTCKVWTELWSALPSNKSQFPVNGFSVPRKWLPSSQEMVSQFPGHGYLVPGEIPFWLTASHLLGYGFSVPRKLVSSSQFATEVLSSCSPPIWSRSRVPCFALALGFS